jgi:hypothetical protein
VGVKGSPKVSLPCRPHPTQWKDGLKSEPGKAGGARAASV